MAATINKRDVYLLAATPRTVSVNLGTNVNVDGTVDGVAASTVKNNAATAAAHAASSGNPHGVSLTQISGDLDDIGDGSTYFRTTSNQVTGAGRGFNALNSSNEYIKSLKSTQLTVVGSNPTTGWVGDANGIRMYQSGLLTVNIPTVGTPSFAGDITGGGDITITGYGDFTGAGNVSGVNASLHANRLNNAGTGVYAEAGNSANDNGVRGVAGGSSVNYGVHGEAQSVNAVGVYAHHTSSGVALKVVGTMTMTSTAVVSNLNADMVDGKHASSLCQIVPTDSGTCTVSGNGFNLNVTGGLAATVRTRGTGNTVFIENVSDARLKQDIEDEKYGLDFINALSPRSYRMRSNPSILAHGLIYQEVEKLIKGTDTLASLNSDGTGAVDYNGMVSPIVLAIQQLSKKITLIEQRGGYKNGS